MRNKYGIIPIVVRAKDKTTIDLSNITYDDVVVKGNLKDAKGGKLIALDLLIENVDNDYILCKTITTLYEDDNYVDIGVIGIDYQNNKGCLITLSTNVINIVRM